jgi:hypothetical protein
MQRKPNPRTLAIGFLTLSATLSVAILALRNLYDDEIASFGTITLPFAAIVRALAHSDVHPPGMYLLAHVALRIVPSFRWLNLFPLIFFYAGLSVFVLCVTPIFIRIRSQICFLLLATLHPLLLMWGNTFRWYSWWTSLALITLVVALQPRKPRPTLTLPRALSIGLLLGGLFYLNYITFLFAASLAVAMFVRYRTQPHRQLANCALATLLVFTVLIAPQLHTMVAVHLPGSDGQRSSLVVSFARLLLSLTASEAFLPWHPLAILATLLFITLGIAAATALRARNNTDERSPSLTAGLRPAIFCVLIFATLFIVLVVISGLGGKPRNGLLLIPVLAPAVAIAFGTLRPRVQTAVLLFFAIWSGTGAAHLLGRYGLIKATMDDRPEQVINFIRHDGDGDCPVVVTYDGGLSFALSQSRLPGLVLVSDNDEPNIPGGPPQSTGGCTHLRLYAVRSYQGDDNSLTQDLAGEVETSTHFIQGHAQTDSFSPDPDASMKRRLAHLSGASGDLSAATRLPDYRFVVISGPIDPRTVPALLRALPDFISSSAPATPAKP